MITVLWETSVTVQYFFFFPAGIAKILQHEHLLSLFLLGGSATGILACYATGLFVGHLIECIKLPFHPQDLSMGTVAGACHRAKVKQGVVV
jgi:hypothetical protein